MEWLDKFYKEGFIITDVEDQQGLRALRTEIVNYTKKLIGETSNIDEEEFLNKFHERNIPEFEINEIRKKLVFDLSLEGKFNKRIFELIKNTLNELLGADILGQKTANFSIQSPNQENIIPVHRDAPVNSQFELVVWLPLVDVFKTKSMFLLNKVESIKALSEFKDQENGYQKYCDFAEKKASYASVTFGKVLLFQPNCGHGANINTENETRWTINIRYKHMFTPFGEKNPLNFFDIIKLSPLSKIALESIDFESKLGL